MIYIKFRITNQDTLYQDTPSQQFNQDNHVSFKKITHLQSTI